MKLQLIVLTAIVIAFFAGVAMMDEDRTTLLKEDRTLLVMRGIGHDILLSAGDSTSRVLPVKRLKDNTFLLQFENPFSFEPDTLVKVIHSSLESSGLPLQYMASIINRMDGTVIYGYEIARDEENSIISCVGRKQSIGPYQLKIVFSKAPTSIMSLSNNLKFVPLMTAIFLSLISLVYVKNRKKKASIEIVESMPIGNYNLYFTQRLLVIGSKRIKLTTKESKLLKVFADNQNQLLSRDRLLKEVWEDEGVFVGRSLDVFVSRLRRKLSADRSARITNVHGMGYKLETGPVISDT